MGIRSRINALWPVRAVRKRVPPAWVDVEKPVLSETFSGGNAASWPSPAWVNVITPAGGGASVTGGVGRLTTGTAGGYSSADFVGVRSNVVFADAQIELTFTILDQDVTGVDLLLRTDTTLDRGNAVVVELRRDRIRISSLTGWVSTQYASADHWLTPGVAYRAKVTLAGGVIAAQLALVGSATPITAVEATGVARTDPGSWGIVVPNGFNPGVMYVDVDNVQVRSAKGRDWTVSPFSSASIWNTAVGTNATYLPMSLTAPPMFGDSSTYIVLDRTAPLRRLIDRGFYYEWPGGVWRDGNQVLGTDTGVQVHFPDNYLIPPPPDGAMPDRPSAGIAANGNIREFQYTVRPTVGSNISIYESARAEYDPRGDGQTMLAGSFGGHGGSGLTAVGGALRVAEVRSNAPIRHVLSFTFNLTRWGTKSGGGISSGYRWPALWADSAYASTSTGVGYGTLGDTPRSGLGSGSLLAIPSTIDLNSIGLETDLGKRLAWTIQNYGGYVADNTGENPTWKIWQINSEVGVEGLNVGSVGTPASNTAYGRDMARIYTRLAVVSNNGPSTVGGGGTPLQPALPPLK